jgi:hypothetical protein
VESWGMIGEFQGVWQKAVVVCSKLSWPSLGFSQKNRENTRKIAVPVWDPTWRGLPNIIQRRYYMDQLDHFLTNVTQTHRKEAH